MTVTYEDPRLRHSLRENFRSIPKAGYEKHKWQPGQEFAFIPKGSGVLLVPVPERDQLAEVAKGAKAGNYHDRKDRFDAPALIAYGDTSFSAAAFSASAFASLL